jgi:hypothetical protein
MKQINENRKAESLLRDGKPDHLDWTAIEAYNAKQVTKPVAVRRKKKGISQTEVTSAILATIAVSAMLIYIFTF